MKSILLICFSFFIISCGDSSATSVSTINNSIPKINDTKISYFIDSPVEGLDFTCGNDTGITKKNGLFEYNINCGTLLFHIGNITIGTISSKNIKSITYPSDISSISRNSEDYHFQ